MKFIGIPRKTKDKSISLSFITGILLSAALIAVCAVGVQSMMNGATNNSQSDAQAPALIDDTYFSADAAVPALDNRSGEDLFDGLLTESSSALDTTAQAKDPTESDMHTTPALSGADASSATIAATSSAASDAAPTPVTTTAEPVTTKAAAAVVSESQASGVFYPKGDINVRQGPSSSHAVAYTLTSTDAVTVIAKTDNGWYKIGENQYISSEILSNSPSEWKLTGTYYLSGNSNIRTGPGTQYSVAKELPAGSAIDVVAETSNGWYRTAVGTYVKKELCSSTKKPDVQPTPKPTPAPTPAPTSPPSSQENANQSNTVAGTYLGRFKVVYYGPQRRADGSYSTTTATGATCRVGVTVAVDPAVIPLGSKVYVDGISIAGNGGYFTAQDTGGAIKGNIIDIYVSSEEEAAKMNNGIYTDVYLVK